MASVPRLVRTETVLRPIPGQVAPAVDAGAELVGGIGRGLGAVASVVARERQRVDEIRLNAAETALREAQTGLLYDPKKGALTRRGLAAQTVGEDFESEWESAVGRIESDLSTPEQRLAFRARAGTLGEAARRQVMSHQDGELRAADDQSFKALTATTLEAVQRSGAAGDDAAATALLREQEARLTAYAARNGWTPEARDAALVAQRSSARMAQIGAMVEAGNAEGATALLAKYSADLTVDDRAKVTRWAAGGTARMMAQRAEDALVTEFAGDERAALAAARGRYTGEMRDDVVQRLEARFADERRFKNEQITAAYDEALAIVDETGDLSRVPVARLDFLRAEKPSTLAALRTRAKQVRTSTEPEVNWGKWQEITEMSADELRAMNPAEYRPYLNDALFKELLDRRATVGGTGGRAGRETATPMSVIDGELMASARSMGLVSNNIARLSQLKGDAAARYTNLRTAVMAEVTRARSEKGGNLSPDETREAMTRVLDDVVLKESRWGGGQVMPRAYTRADDRLRPLTDAERANLGLRAGTVPPLRPGTSKADRWEELRRSGLDPAAATARVNQEMP